MKKTPIAFALLGSVLLISTSLQAAPTTAQLKVTGQLTIPSCSIDVDNNGTYDFGNISSTMIQPNSETTLAAMSKTWTVTCDAQTYLNISTVDERKDTSTGGSSWKFGLGTVNTDGKLGYYIVVLTGAKVDGKDVKFFNSTSSGFVPITTAWLYTDKLAGWATGVNTQASGQVFQADLAVTPTLASAKTMNGPIKDAASLDGALTLNFAYGI